MGATFLFPEERQRSMVNNVGVVAAWLQWGRVSCLIFVSQIVGRCAKLHQNCIHNICLNVLGVSSSKTSSNCFLEHLVIFFSFQWTQLHVNVDRGMF